MTASLSLLLPTLAERLTTALDARGLPACRPAELIAQGDGKIPAEPTAPGQHRPLPLDAAGGCCYLRRTGDATLEPFSTLQNCAGKRVRVTLPLRLVVVADLDRLECRDREVGLVLAEYLLGALEAAGLPLAALGAAGGKTVPRRLSSDPVRILTEELGFPAPLPARRGLATLDLELELVVDPACLPTCLPNA